MTKHILITLSIAVVLGIFVLVFRAAQRITETLPIPTRAAFPPSPALSPLTTSEEPSPSPVEIASPTTSSLAVVTPSLTPKESLTLPPPPQTPVATPSPAPTPTSSQTWPAPTSSPVASPTPAPGSTSSPQATPVPTLSPSPRHEPRQFFVFIINSQFQPQAIELRVGDTVTWTNKDKGVLHWPASDPHPTHTAFQGFDPLGDLAYQESFSYTFLYPATLLYHDHSAAVVAGVATIKGTVTVRE